jgi:hypothetical protein
MALSSSYISESCRYVYCALALSNVVVAIATVSCLYKALVHATAISVKLLLLLLLMLS